MEATLLSVEEMVVPSPEAMLSEKPGAVGNQNLSSVGSGSAGSGTQVGFGNAAPAPKSSGLGEPLGS